MTSQDSTKRVMFRWATLKGLIAAIIFLALAVMAEYLVVLYAISLGLKDYSLLQYSFKFPGTDWIIALAISPLFHLVPICVIVMLTSCWVYLTKYVAIKTPEKLKTRFQATQKKSFFSKMKIGLQKSKFAVYVRGKTGFGGGTFTNAVLVFFVFAVFILAMSLLAYPQLIYRAVSSVFQNNTSVLEFVRNTGAALSSAAGVFAGINNALLYASPGFRDFATGLGNIFTPLASMDSAGKYLVFQNAAAWVSALLILLYGERVRSGRRYRKIGK